MADQRQLCTFFLEERFFGIEVERVQEVIRYQTVTPVPLAPAVVRGLINLRGQIVTAIDLRRLLQVEDRADERLPINIVMHARQGIFSLLVDRIGDVLEVDEDSFEHPPDTLDGIARELIRGAYKLQGRLLLVLNIAKLFSPEILHRGHPMADA
ncbi:MAG: chemotaxis protein CheW [Candidatus Competibacter denitrificans]|jgi:purine-binding chemotaxis protein CheW|uniref:Chemotaxis signal transduction protein CheW n=1 Tax=Candidatus Competibacter denitrificans Run_A_D11 TaxID=1400863 RepID=W6M4E9_9GAMM|nr:chemotaxis protein CheW [Candidatus Competibacter denitrificans]CDI02557.1 putative chemotaxis signal transduction protein CheW [Candidatus Competibacter denitrificans Run_A_D11]HCK81591.1 chemotaxis protein CheW [Candidatus Competibacteraceae bacterium]HRC69545.1 chemotaxis protein CheW [Candidatus Competibacter denitrificans]